MDPSRRQIQTFRPRCRAPLGAAASVTIYLVLADVVSAPLHARGWGQPVLGLVNGLSRLVQMPALFLVEFAGYRTGHHTSWGAWVLIVIVTALGCAGVTFVLGAARRRLTRASRPAPPGDAHPPAAPRRPHPSRRQVLRAGAGVAALGAAGAFGYSFLVEPRRFRVTRRSFALPGLPPELAGLRVAQLTDIHHGPWLSLGYVRSVVEATNALRPDLILLTGDYVHQSPAYVAPVVEALARLRAGLGVVGVLGNHDWWEDGPLVQREFTRHGLPLLDNQRLFVTRGRRLAESADEGLCLAGVGDLWEGRPDYAAALGGVPPAMPRLLLSHNPDVAEERALVAGGYRVDLMVSGHTHGGQVYVPGVGTPVVPSRYGQKYAHGLVRGPACPVWVSAGLGMAVLPVRCGVPPEIAVLELTPAPSNA